MSKIADTTIPLKINQYYHVYNRGNNGKNMFFQIRNYDFFLQRYFKYMNPYWNTFAYALLPNHFHLLIQVKDGKTLVEAAKKDLKKVDKNFIRRFLPKFEAISLKIADLADRQYLNKENYRDCFGKDDYRTFCYELVEWIATEPFRRFMISYAKAVNKQEERHGSLLQKKFRRKHLSTELDCIQLTKYIHRNPIHHGTAVNLSDSEWTSYHSILSTEKTNLKREKVLEWFKDREHFKSEHEKYTNDWKNGEHWIIED